MNPADIQPPVPSAPVDADYYRRQLETVAENASLALFIMDEHQRCTYMNRAAEEMTGFRLDELQGKELHYYIHHTRPDGSPYPLEECPIDQAFPQNMREKGEEVFVHKDGHQYPVSFTASPIRKGDRTVGTIIEARDITGEKEREVAVRREQERYRFLAETIPAQVWTSRPDGRLDYVNERTARYFGVPAAQVLEDGWRDVLHPDDLALAVRRWTHALTTGDPYEVEFRLRRADGEYRWHLARADAMRNADGEITTWFGVNTDVHDQKEAESERDHALRAAQAERQHLARIFQNAPAFIATLRGPEHVFEMANPVYAQLVGHRDILGKPVREALPEAVEQGFVGLLDEVYRSGEPFVGNGMRIALQRTPGAALEDRFLNFVYQPLLDADGVVSGILAHGVDVTDQVEAQRVMEEQAAELETQKEELQLQAHRMEEVQVELEVSNEELQRAGEEMARERAHLAAIIEFAPVGIVIAEAPSGRIVMGNRRVEEIFRHPVLPSGSVDEYGDWTAFHPDGRRVQGHEYPLGRVFTTGERAGPDEYLYQRGDGTLAWVQITGVPIRDTRGELASALVVIDDVDAERRAQAESARLIRDLEVERERLRTILTSAPAQIAVVRGPEYVFEFANPPYLASVGNREILGRPALEALHELANQGFREMLDGVYHTGQPFAINEVPAAVDRHGDGVMEEGFYNLVLQPLLDSDGKVEAILSHTIDVTGQVRARRDVEQLEERLRLAVQAADVGIYDWDTVSPVLSWDPRARRIFGVPEDAVVTFDTFNEHLHPDDREAANHAVARALDPAEGGDFLTEYRVVHTDGSTRWVRAAGRVLFEGAGEARRPVRFLGTMQDVTERRHAEEERESLIREMETGRARLEQIFTEAPAVMALYTGPEHIITLVNPTWERTVGKPGAVGRPFREVFPEFAESGLFELLDRVYETGEPFSDPEVNVPLERFGSGVMEDSYWNLVWRPLAGDGPQGRDILVHAVEVTTQVVARREVEEKAAELARAAQALEASNRELDQFAYVASHDLKAPLRGISNISTWIEEDMGGELPPTVRDHLELLRGRVHRMEGLIDGILQYSRAGRVRETPARVDSGELVGDVVELIAPPAGVRIDVAERMPTLWTERLPLQQVFMNLIGNAVKYAGGAEPLVRVSARDAGDEWEFAVADNGPGIAPEYHERIFGIFQMLEARDKVEGTGIGLSIVKKLVESRGGRVWVESEEGSGSTFRFLWPKTHAAEEDA